jgi:hypothetical protein
MEILIAIELIAGAIFVAMFIMNLERELEMRSNRHLLALYDDEDADAEGETAAIDGELRRGTQRTAIAGSDHHGSVLIGRH